MNSKPLCRLHFALAAQQGECWWPIFFIASRRETVLMKGTGITVKLVPFDGGGPMLVALLGGHIDVGSTPPIMYAPHRNTGMITPFLLSKTNAIPNFPVFPQARKKVQRRD
jgi:hypothetical protein